ncbi:hypothetical protein DFQ27_004808 [Actinomortierella ambigua]|uniref:Uncharacterized protein n=1 Tax=Actinomortierella ambigua TaxID=1343610 RepID=A0A9P6U2T6_9FUNG|nr:hypothetical protein DFQ27_004808 [Actinomortierella ambigua]
MSLQVNFTTHGKDLRVTYEDILNSSSGNDWALFGYDKGTNDLKVLGTGNGGLDELQEEFVDGKIQYAFARVTDPNSSLNKFVLIGWCGDGVPESKKGLFNTHLADVARFLKGYHLQINARSEADVTPQQIMKRIDEASASKYSFHKETSKGRDLISPLQSAYKKTEVPDIAAMQRTAPKPEPTPKYSVGASSKPVMPASSTPVSARWNPAGISSSSTSSTTTNTATTSTSSYSSSSTPTKPFTPPTPSSTTTTSTPSWRSGGGSSYVPPSAAGFNRVAPPSSLSSYAVERNEPTMNKAAQMRLEREQREREERARIEQEIKDREARENAADQSAAASRVAEERRLQEEMERKKAKQEEEERLRRQRQEDEQQEKARQAKEKEEAEMGARAAREAAKAREQGEIEAARARARKEEEAREAEAAAAAAAVTAAAASAAAVDAARKRAEEEEEEERRRHRELQEAEEAEARRRAAEEEAAAAAAAAAAEEEARRRHQEEEDESERRLQEDMHAAAAKSVNAGADALIASSEHPERATGPQSKSAVVLYSYEAAEANEMSLLEGEILFNVSELDVGWWSGESEDGARSGLFPANYVELIEHAHQDHYDDGAAAAAAAAEAEAAEATAAAHEEASYHAAGAGAGASHASDKPSAVALYDYAAGEPNEISFVEGETILEIEQVTDDWWQGVNHKGETGLFPANYVELHQ